MAGKNQIDKLVTITIDDAIVSVPNYPTDFNEYEINVWNECWKFLNRYELSTTVDIDIVVMYCRECSIYNDAVINLKANGLTSINGSGGDIQSPYIAIKNSAIANIIKIASEFGFTPNGRVKIKPQKPNRKKSKFDELLSSD